MIFELFSYTIAISKFLSMHLVKKGMGGGWLPSDIF
jgi:hypothetical protein